MLAGADAGEREERAFVRKIFIVTKLVSHAPGAALLAQAPIRSRWIPEDGEAGIAHREAAVY